MKILHFILGKANPDRANGVNQVIYGLAKYQRLAGHEVSVIGISKSMELSYELIDRKYFQVEAYRTFKDVIERLKEICPDIDIVHLHGVWNRMNICICKYLEHIEKPYVITAHCGYSLDRLKQSNYWLKLIYHRLWQKHLYENAAAVHALTREESTDIAHFCPKSNIFVISNGVDPEIYDKYTYQLHNRKKVRFGYLGRLSKEKNIDNLIKAFSLLPNIFREQVELYLIGPKNNDYEKLREFTKNLGLEDIVTFTGERFGEEKIDALLDLDVYVHPAYSDVVGISVMEALALGLPTIVTRTSHMSYFYNSGAFIMVEPTAVELCRGITEILNDKKTWKTLSLKAKELYKSTFNWTEVVNKMLEQYRILIT